MVHPGIRITARCGGTIRITRVAAAVAARAAAPKAVVEVVAVPARAAAARVVLPVLPVHQAGRAQGGPPRVGRPDCCYDFLLYMC